MLHSHKITFLKNTFSKSAHGTVWNERISGYKKVYTSCFQVFLCSKGIVKPAWNTLLLLMYVCLFLLKMWITMLLYSSVFHFGDNDINGIYFYSCYLNKGKYRERKFSLCDAEINPLNKHRGD